MTAKNDLINVLKIICEWHSRVDCLSDLKYILPIANKHKIKLDIYPIKDILSFPKEYDFDDEMITQLKENQKFKLLS